MDRHINKLIDGQMDAVWIVVIVVSVLYPCYDIMY